MKQILTLCSCLIFSLTMWAQVGKAAKQKAELISIGVKDGFYSKLLKEDRQLNIYLPEGYNETDTARYPVIYLLDGALDEDFIHIVGLVQFNTFPWINRIPKSIVVGIVSGDRRRDFAFPTTVKEDKEKFPTTGGSEKFITFLENELLPYIQNQYRTNNSKMLIGQSLGGLLAAEVLLKKPHLFNQYIIISPSLWWDDGSLLEQNFVSPRDSLSVYLAVGKEGITPGAKPRVMEDDVKLFAEKIKSETKNTQLFFEYLPDEDHATIMHQAVFNAFKLMSKPAK